MERTYLAIDLKSFYASVECVARGLNPLTTNLVVADASRTEKTICLAVSPSLKAYGIPGRPRLFEVVQKVKELNNRKLSTLRGHRFTGESFSSIDLAQYPSLAISYITAMPRMAAYLATSTTIYNIYLKYIAREDIHVYSIDEVFMDVTSYLKSYNLSAQALAKTIIHEVLETTGITATAGIGTNLYLAKIAMDIVAKHLPPDENGVRIASLDETSYRRELWSHTPLTDFWRIGHGYADKLELNGMRTMGDVARCSVKNEEKLYSLFGVNAELLIDHAWGWEPCTIADIKAYKPSANSLGTGQVLSCAYTAEKGRLVVHEMAELLALDLVAKKLVTDQLVLNVCYDIENLTDQQRKQAYHGAIITDGFGRQMPKPVHGSINLEFPTSSSKLVDKAVLELYDRIVDRTLLVRRFNVTATHVIDEETAKREPLQLDLFKVVDKDTDEAALEKEKKLQQTVIDLKKRFGKNAVLKGMNLEEGATTIIRNGQIGGHNA